jgi:anti-sigma factor RsiW
VLAIALAMQSGGVPPRASATREIAAPVHSVALLDGALGDFARVSAGDLPGRSRDLSAVRAAVSFPFEPLHAPNLRLVGAWTTELRGEPAAVLAYRLDDRLVVQYLVAEDAFFRHPAVRAAVADRHLLTAAVGGRSIVAWPDAATGTVLVGDVPARQLRDIWTTERLH